MSSEPTFTDAFNLNLAGLGNRIIPLFPSPCLQNNGGFIMSDSLEKVCSTCKISQPFINFHKNKSRSDGYEYICKICSKARAKKYVEANKEQLVLRHAEYYSKNKEQIDLRQAEYTKNNKERRAEYYKNNKERFASKAIVYRANNRECIALRKAEYQKKHKEQISLQMAEYYRKNKERISLRQVEYRKLNPDIFLAFSHKRRANKKKGGGSYTPGQISIQDKRQKNKCYYCNKKMGIKRTIEHIIPLSRGGSNDMSNIVLACSHCNLTKHNRLPHEWSQGGRLL